MGTVTASSLLNNNDGSYQRVDCTLAFGSSYNNSGNPATTGETITAASVGLSQIISITTPSEEAGYGFEVLGLDSTPKSSARIAVFQGGSGTTGATSGGTPAGTNGTSAVSGTAAAQVFTGTASALNLASPVFSGTGLTAVGQDITTTDNQTMTLNQCAGMWLISATGATPPNLILSNTAVTGAPAVFTVQGAASTDAGAYKVVATIPVGTNAASASLTATAAAQIFTGSALATHTHSIGAGAGAEVPNGTNLSTALAAVRVTVCGY